MNQKTDLHTLTASFKQLSTTTKRYYAIVIVVLVGSLYIFLVIQTNTYINAQPDETTIQADTAKKLRVDTDVAQQLKNLRDNSVTIQAIPSEKRSNPFEE